MKVQESDLGRLVPISAGGFGRVFRVEGYRLPGDAALAYKAFTREEASQASSATAAIKFRDSLGLSGREDLDRYTAWPRTLVFDARGSVSGLLMPLFRQDFFCRMVDDNSGAMVLKPREATWLIASAAQRQAAGIELRDVTRVERLTLLAQLVRTIALLHRHGWVFGDITLRDIVFKLDPPLITLLNCDGAAPLNDLSRRQALTPFWLPPELEYPPSQNLQDKITDVYKLGLAILRVLSPGRGAATAVDPERLVDQLDAEGVRLTARALSPDRLERPSAQELYDYLDRVITPARGTAAAPGARRGEGSPTSRVDGASGVQIGSGNFQVNYFYGNPPRTGESGARLAPASGAAGPSSRGHAFISYVREDSGKVDALQKMLEAAGIPVWRDTSSLWPGEDWRAKIRSTISRDALVFIACFSSHSAARHQSYQNEELLLAIDQLRRRRPDDPWLIPVRFDECEVPDHELGAGRTLASIHRADLFGVNRELAARRLVEAVQRLLQEPAAGGSPRGGQGVAPRKRLSPPWRH